VSIGVIVAWGRMRAYMDVGDAGMLPAGESVPVREGERPRRTELRGESRAPGVSWPLDVSRRRSFPGDSGGGDRRGVTVRPSAIVHHDRDSVRTYRGRKTWQSAWQLVGERETKRDAGDGGVRRRKEALGRR
jgi:hypothetical protein